MKALYDIKFVLYIYNGNQIIYHEEVILFHIIEIQEIIIRDKVLEGQKMYYEIVFSNLHFNVEVIAFVIMNKLKSYNLTFLKPLNISCYWVTLNDCLLLSCRVIHFRIPFYWRCLYKTIYLILFILGWIIDIRILSSLKFLRGN